MTKYISERAISPVSPTDILTIANAARKDRLSGNKVIDGSIGVFLNDDKSLNGVSEIREELKNHIDDQLSYPPILGSDEYREAVLSWLLQDKLKEAEERFYIPFGATLGGTGACHIAFGTFLDRGDEVLLPDVMWGNYSLIAETNGLKAGFYRLIDEKDAFDIKSISDRIAELSRKQKHVLAVINDPCQNPTGYCLSKTEYDALFDKLDELGRETDLTILFDIAYINYDLRFKGVHPLFGHALARQHSFLPAFAFSASKTFGIYGLRVGALFALTSDKGTSECLLNSIGTHARSIYSCPNGPALHVIALAIHDKGKREALISHIRENADSLAKRGALIISLLKESGIRHMPYMKGFFITLLSDDAFRAASRLKELHSYTVPMDCHHLRLAISGLNDEEAAVLVKQLKEVL